MAMAMDVDEPNIVYLPQATLPSLWSVDDYAPHLDQGTPLVIDNGSTSLRWGWSTSEMPYHGINIISKYKERKSNKALVVFGEAVDLDSTAKAQAKTAWEGDILINFDALVSWFTS
jgi:actin-related protein 5